MTAKEIRESLLWELNVLTQPIGVNDDIPNEDIEKCYLVIKELLNNKNIEVSELTLLASFRYALGRQTYIVSEVARRVCGGGHFFK